MVEKIPSLDWISSQQQEMLPLLMSWSAINSSSDNLSGLAHMLEALETRFSLLQGKMEKISLSPRTAISQSGDLITLPHGQALRITKRSQAPIQILLAGHMDTVYSLLHPFQSVSILNDHTLQGPGVADMKGGLLIMLTALEALEKHPQAQNVGWEVIINPDEEVGSIGSEHLFVEAAKRNHLGLIFEPSFADGAMVSSRKGSVNFSVVAKGKAAHAGRDFENGRNAIVAIANFITKANQLNNKDRGISINPGYIAGGGPVNIVPDLAICRCNARAIHPSDFAHMQKELRALVDESPIEDVQLLFHHEQARRPKVFDEKCRRLFEMINLIAKEQGYSLSYRSSGGVCDGNILAAEGLPVIDTLGAIGGEIHTSNEYILIDSLIKRSRLVGGFLIRLATGELKIDL